MDVLVGGAAVLVKHALRRKRGWRASTLVKLRKRGFRTVLPRITLSGPEVGQSHWLHCEKGPAEAVFPPPSKEDQPATGAAKTVNICHHQDCPVFIYTSEVMHRVADVCLWVGNEFRYMANILSEPWFRSFNIELWCSSSSLVRSATKTDIRRLERTGRTAERIIGAPLPSLQELYTSRVRKRAKKVTLDSSHPAHSLIELLPSGRRYRAQKQPDTRTVFTPRPYPTWTIHNTPQHCTAVNNSSNLHLYIGHMHMQMQTHLAIKLFLILKF